MVLLPSVAGSQESCSTFHHMSRIIERTSQNPGRHLEIEDGLLIGILSDLMHGYRRNLRIGGTERIPSKEQLDAWVEGKNMPYVSELVEEVLAGYQENSHLARYQAEAEHKHCTVESLLQRAIFSNREEIYCRAEINKKEN
mgnify:CR=1 FL=1